MIDYDVGGNQYFFGKNCKESDNMLILLESMEFLLLAELEYLEVLVDILVFFASNTVGCFGYALLQV